MQLAAVLAEIAVAVLPAVASDMTEARILSDGFS
jgi:hypothetical protein